MTPSISDLHVVLRRCWSYETAVPDTIWDPNVPAKGQCAVTALIVQDYLGGDLLRTMNPRDTAGRFPISHYFNLVDGREVDLTRSQFWLWEPGEIIIRDREYVLSNESTAMRYEKLRERVSRNLGGSDTLVIVR